MADAMKLVPVDLEAMDHVAESLSAMGRISDGNLIVSAAVEIADLRRAASPPAHEEAPAEGVGDMDYVSNVIARAVNAFATGAGVKVRVEPKTCGSHAEAIVDYLRTQAPDSWRPIETAPKDGVFIVGYDDEVARRARLDPHQRVYEARWDERQDTWTSRNGFILHSDATHWMPLPAAPALRPQTAESGK